MSSFDNNFHKLTNGVLYLNGNSTYGKTEEINNPKITAKMIEHKVAGMVGTVQLSSGYDKMEASFKLNGPVPEIASSPFKPPAMVSSLTFLKFNPSFILFNY